MNTRNEDIDGLRYGSNCSLPVQSSGRSYYPMSWRIGILHVLVVAAVSQPACAVDITDQRGRSVAFEKLPQRVVFLPIP
jgi:hypothetical protein